MTQPKTQREKLRIARIRDEKRKKTNLTKSLKIRLSEELWYDWKNYCEDNSVCGSETLRHLMLTLIGDKAEVVDARAVERGRVFLRQMLALTDKAI